MFVRSRVRCVFSTRNLSIYLSIYPLRTRTTLQGMHRAASGGGPPVEQRRGWRSVRGLFDEQTAATASASSAPATAGQHQAHLRGVKPSPLHVLTFATGSYLRWLVLLHANLRLLALPATELSVCTGDETSRFSDGSSHPEKGSSEKCLSPQWTRSREVARSRAPSSWCAPRLALRGRANRLGSVQGRRWPAYAEHTVRKWVYLMDYPNLRVDNAYRVWMRERSAHLWVRLEDLLEGGRAEYELRRVLDFVLDGQYRVGGRVVRCALQKATATLRAANRAEKEDCVVVHGGAPNCCAQCAMRRAFEHTFERGNHGRGQSALPSTTTNRSVGDAVWKVAEGVAPNFGYTRQGYTALGPHSRPSLGAQSSTAQLLECDCPEH